MDKISTKVLSSLEKCFIDENLDSKQEILKFKALKGQHISFQLAYIKENGNDTSTFVSPVIEGEIKEHVTAREVVYVPSSFPAPIKGADEYYLRKSIGLYPDPLRPLRYNGQVCVCPGHLHSLWFEVNFPKDMKAGEYHLKIALREGHEGKVVSEEKNIKIELLNLELPHQEMIHTEWFYSDCIAEAHHVDVFSDEHFALMASYIKVAVKNGINMILTPIFTPEIDTYRGGERLTTQLLKIKVTGKNKYEFNFDLVDRFIDMCLDAGVEYFEIPHFYTQWGAEHAPKFIGEVSGEEKRIFGWETDSLGEEYKSFLSQLIPAIVSHMKSRGIDKKCFYHVSDEPHLNQIEHYTACKNQIAPYLEGYHIIDALSNYEFYNSGALKKPVPFIGDIEPFIKNNVKGLWAYYCGVCAGKNGTGRCHAMPSARTRILGVLLYIMNIEGFLHWGYNFYHNRNSYDIIDPFAETAAEYFAPSGDAFLVYPGKNEALESQRLVSMREAMEDHRMLKLYESKFGREKTLSMLKEIAGFEISPSDYPRNNEFFSELFERITKDIM